jgi:SPP1 family predicted phage head-tail adaptor
MAFNRFTSSARNRQIVIERKHVAADDYGGQTETWSMRCQPWAHVNFGSGAERREAAQLAASAPATFSVLRSAATAAVSVEDRIQFDGAIWEIGSVVPSREYNVGIDITAIRSTT